MEITLVLIWFNLLTTLKKFSDSVSREDKGLAYLIMYPVLNKLVVETRMAVWEPAWAAKAQRVWLAEWTRIPFLDLTVQQIEVSWNAEPFSMSYQNDFLVFRVTVNVTLEITDEDLS